MKPIPILFAAFVICGCQRGIESDYTEWRKAEVDYKETHSIRGNYDSERRFALETDAYKKLLSHGKISHDFIIQKFIEHTENKYDGYSWDGFFAYGIADLYSVKYYDLEMTPNDVAQTVYELIKQPESNQSH